MTAPRSLWCQGCGNELRVPVSNGPAIVLPPCYRCCATHWATFRPLVAPDIECVGGPDDGDTAPNVGGELATFEREGGYYRKGMEAGTWCWIWERDEEEEAA